MKIVPAEREIDRSTQLERPYHIWEPNGKYPLQETIDELIRAYMNEDIIICYPKPEGFESRYGMDVPEEPNAVYDEHYFRIGSSPKYGVVYGIKTVLRPRRAI